jgi:hypothetical protein
LKEIIPFASAQKLPFDVLELLPDGEAGCSTLFQDKVEKESGKRRIHSKVDSEILE